MIFAANFKMNHTRRSTQLWLEEMERHVAGSKNGDALYCFPPATALCPSTERITVGAQNAYPAAKGAYTGEIGLEQLEEFGTRTVLIGHSERREILGESQELVSEKFRFFAEQGFEILYCIGEPLEGREEGEEAIYEYLWEEFVGIDTDYGKLIVAYEPIWAIGTGRSADTEEIAAVHAELRRRIAGPLLYGGSVNPDNIAAITSIENVDGVLVGSASLKPESFATLIERSRGV
jgi:triosephosphate isomerase